MLRKHLSLERLLALVLVITLTVTSLPLTVLAEKISEGHDYVVYKAPEIQEELKEEILEDPDSNLEFNPDIEGYNAFVDDAKDKEVSILGEITTLRNRKQKHVKLSDGTQMVNIYPLDVHYLRNGIWEEIDNTLVQSTENNRVNVSRSNLDISLSKNTLTDRLVSLNEVSLALKPELRSVLNINNSK